MLPNRRVVGQRNVSSARLGGRRSTGSGCPRSWAPLDDANASCCAWSDGCILIGEKSGAFARLREEPVEHAYKRFVGAADAALGIICAVQTVVDPRSSGFKSPACSLPVGLDGKRLARRAMLTTHCAGIESKLSDSLCAVRSSVSVTGPGGVRVLNVITAPRDDPVLTVWVDAGRIGWCRSIEQL